MGLVKQWHASSEASHQSGTSGPIAEVREASYPATSDIGVLGQNTVRRSCISFLHAASTYFTTTELMYDWSDLRLAFIMSFFTATSHTSYCIFPSPKFHQLEEVKIQVLHSDFTVLWTSKTFCRTWKPWWNCIVDLFFFTVNSFLSGQWQNQLG